MDQASIPRARAARDPKALGGWSVRDEIQQLYEVGLCAMPIQLYWDDGMAKSKTREPAKARKAAHYSKWAHMKTPKSWSDSISEAIRQLRKADGVAILTEASRLFVIDIDVTSDNTEEPGMNLWNRLVEAHGEPETLKAKSGSGGSNYYFKLDSPGLTWKRNFESVIVDGKNYGVDGRAEGAHPSSYIDGRGKLKMYEWYNGPPSYEACREMPSWLVDLVNNHAGQPAIASSEKTDSKEAIFEPPPELKSVLERFPASDFVEQVNGAHKRSTAV
jgi:hypothetical protein